MYNQSISQLNIVSWNCQSIINKICETSDFLLKHDIDIALFTETWLTPNKNIHIPNYTTYRFDRISGQHGGVAISIKSNITHTLLKSSNTTVIESIGLSILSRNQQIIFICCYYPGTTNDTHSINLFKHDIRKLTNTNTSYFLIGDFNAKHRLWNNCRANQAGKALYDEMSTRNFIVHHSQTPTYFPPQARAIHPSTIDIVLTNNLHHISTITTSNELTSDHLPILFSVHCFEIPNNTPTLTLRYDLADWTKFKNSLNEQINLGSLELTTTSDIDQSITLFTNAIKHSISLSIPNKPTTQNQIPIPNQMKDLICERNIVRRQWQRNRDPSLKIRINQLNHSIHKQAFNLRNSSFSKTIEKLEPGSRQFWKVTKVIKNKANIIPPLRDKTTNNILLTDTEKADAIANEFIKAHTLTSNLSNSLIRNQVKATIDSLNSIPISNNIFSIRTSPSEIKSIIKHFKNKKSPGIDNISNRSLKHLPKKCLVFLNYLFNKCFDLQYFPQQWKHAQIIAIPKPNKNHSDPSNYRPISLLSSLSKIFEKIILNRLNNIISDKQLIPNEQFGFRHGHSTCQQLKRVVNHIKNGFKLKKSTGLVVLDVEKAFDSIWHNGLIHKLKVLDIPDNLIKLIQSFLFNRSFFVKIKHSFSSIHKIPSGVPQGSSLSPVLYNLYTSDFPITDNSNIALFADDTAIFYTHENPNYILSNLENTLTNVLSYFHRWKIKTNNSKTQAMFFTRRRAPRFLPDRKLKIHNTEIEWSNDIKYLGLVLDKTLTFKNHTKNQCIKAQKYIKILYPLIHRKSTLNIKNKLLIYKSIFRPIILYASEVWGECAETYIKQLQITQNKCLKLIYNLPFFYSTRLLHEKCQITTISNALQNTKLKFISRCEQSNNQLIVNLTPH